MKINIVTVKSGWILQKIAQRIAATSPEFAVTHAPNTRVDANFYCDVQNCFHGPTNTIDVGLFTHIHANNPDTVVQNPHGLDHIFHMSSRYRHMFHSHFKYPHEKMSIMVPWEIPEEWPVKKQTIGVFQRGKHEGKGFDFVLKLFSERPEICQAYTWLFVGNDWEEVKSVGNKSNIDVTHIPDTRLQYPWDYNDLYEEIDILLIPSLWEGGPISCLEAMAKGIPVIAADVGWCGEMGAIQFDAGSIDHLYAVLEEIGFARRNRLNKVKQFSYKKCADQIVDVVKRLS